MCKNKKWKKEIHSSKNWKYPSIEISCVETHNALHKCPIDLIHVATERSYLVSWTVFWKSSLWNSSSNPKSSFSNSIYAWAWFKKKKKVELEFSKLEFHLKKNNRTRVFYTQVPFELFFFKSMELEFGKLEYHLLFFFFLFFFIKSRSGVNQVWETWFWVGTRVSQIRFSKNSPTY